MPRRQEKQIWRSASAIRLLEFAGGPQTLEEAVKYTAAQLLYGIEVGPTDLEALSAKAGLTEEAAEEAPEDLLHDDGLRFFESEDFVNPTHTRYERVQEIVRAFFASLKPRRHYRGIEFEKICEMMALELLLPVEPLLDAFDKQISVTKVIEVSRQFQVSYRMMARRLMAFPYIAVFEADHEYVSWAYGGIRTGLVDNLSPDIRSIVKYGVVEACEVPLRFFSPRRPWFGSRCVEWAQVAGGKTLFLVRLPRRDEHAQDSSFLTESAPLY